MSFLRSFVVFILSTIFVTAISTAVISYSIGNLLQKDHIKDLLNSKISAYVNEKCQNDCAGYEEGSNCFQLCLSQDLNQTEVGVSNAIDEIYEQKFFGMTLNELSFALSQYSLYIIIGILSGALLFIASKKPFLTLGKDFISTAILFFISSVTPQFIMASVNLPVDIGTSIRDYFSSGFDKLTLYGIIFLVIGAILVIINYIIDRRKNEEPSRSTKEKK